MKTLLSIIFVVTTISCIAQGVTIESYKMTYNDSSGYVTKHQQRQDKLFNAMLFAESYIRDTVTFERYLITTDTLRERYLFGSNAYLNYHKKRYAVTHSVFDSVEVQILK